MVPDLDEPVAPEVAAHETGQPPVDGKAGRADLPALTRIRVLVLVTLGPLLTGYLAVAALLALVTATATDAHFATTGVLAAALPGWLAAHQVPMRILGLELGVLPLLPTIGLAALTAAAASGAAARLGLCKPGQAAKLVTCVAAAHGIAGVIVAVLSSQGDVTADPLPALYFPALVSALAATAGVARRCGLLAAIVHRADEAAVAGLRAGALAVVLLLAAGGALLTFGLLTSIEAAGGMFPAGTGNAVGMLLLSIGYLPNAVVAATAFLAGPGFSIGSAAVSPVAFDGGPVPGVPLLAALPEHEAVWWPALFLLPLAVGVLVGRRLRHVDENPVARLRAVAVAGGVVAVSFVVLGGSAGGRLGRGPFDPVSMGAAALSVALVLWTVVPAALAAWFGGPHPVVERMPGLIDDDPEPESAEPESAEPESAEAGTAKTGVAKTEAADENEPAGEPAEATAEDHEEAEAEPAPEPPEPRG